ncbi:hypothetical protein DM02DRAFT_615126 [Periconia macrospinosa]|uniref:Uncharacterized protein n=1 Tax=Periconia macrospinosa TaxID=97972 RepID=A0A2V1DMC9_9PLEO|nr:hypothetical protein DM02DRAFT_615126 [Periconia macrospinosa]
MRTWSHHPAVPHNYWKSPFRFTHHITSNGEFRVPFPRHVRQLPPTTSQTTCMFPQYSNLPPEIRLQIIQMCDSATLFQLMHTSRETRVEARKLFFSDSEAWYCIEAKWLLYGGHVGDTLFDVDFLACVERLDIDFEYVYVDEFGTLRRGGPRKTAEYEWILNFWKTVQHRFPRVKYIRIRDERNRLPDELPPAIYKNVANMCPAGLNVNVSISLLKRGGSRNSRKRRMIWLLLSTPENLREWVECTNEPPGLNIIPPHKVLRGPVGRYQRTCATRQDISYQRDGIEVHRMAAMEKFHFQNQESPKPFGCSTPGCDAWFENPEEYTSHGIETGHDKNEKLPEQFAALFAENEQRLERLWESWEKEDDSFREEWSGWDESEQRTVAEQEFLHQLEHDPLYAQGQPVLQHKIFKSLAVYITGYLGAVGVHDVALSIRGRNGEIVRGQ